jgi:predicted RNase H-like HicB family nuclease
MAWCPALPGCRTQAATSDGARQLMEDAIRGYLSSLNVAVPQLLEQQLVES